MFNHYRFILTKLAELSYNAVLLSTFLIAPQLLKSLVSLFKSTSIGFFQVLIERLIEEELQQSNLCGTSCLL